MLLLSYFKCDTGKILNTKHKASEWILGKRRHFPHQSRSGNKGRFTLGLKGPKGWEPVVCLCWSIHRKDCVSTTERINYRCFYNKLFKNAIKSSVCAPHSGIQNFSVKVWLAAKITAENQPSWPWEASRQCAKNRWKIAQVPPAPASPSPEARALSRFKYWEFRPDAFRQTKIRSEKCNFFPQAPCLL